MVPYQDKDKAANLGAKWNANMKQWYIPDNIEDVGRLKELIDAYDYQYLAVPFMEKDVVKNLGARWDANAKKWYTLKSNSNIEELRKYFEDDTPLTLVGEDLTCQLEYINLTPRPCFITNSKYFLSAKDWPRVQNFVIQRAEGKCESCERDCNNLRIEEVYQFDDETYIQKLIRYIALCKPCCDLYSMVKGQPNVEHLMLVAGLLREDAEEYIKDRQDIRVSLSNYTWDLDLSILINSGLDIKPIPSGKERLDLVNLTFPPNN